MEYQNIFKELCKIPRASHHEEQVADFLCDFAERHNLRCRRDENNCVVIEKPASPGYEQHDSVVILNHMELIILHLVQIMV